MGMTEFTLTKESKHTERETERMRERESIVMTPDKIIIHHILIQ